MRRSLAAIGLGALASWPAAAAEPVVFANGTATYALSAGGVAAASGVDISGTMVSSLLQSDCDTFRTTAEMDIQIKGMGGMTVTQALSARYVESAASLEFESLQTMLGTTLNASAGVAAREGDGITVTPADSEREPAHLAGPVVFPVAMTRQLIEAARDGDSFSTYLLFDGATGEGNLLTVSAVIGEPESGPVEGIEGSIMEATGWDALARWPVTLTYFQDTDEGERQPTMSITMTLIENGFGIRTVYEMGPVVMSLELVGLQPVDPPACL